MPATVTQTEVPTVGMTVTARPWVDGSEQNPAKGVVVVPEYGNDREYALVWFPSMGALCNEQIGRAYQPILHVKLEVKGTVAGWSATRLRETARIVHASDLGGEVYPLLQAIVKARPHARG